MVSRNRTPHMGQFALVDNRRMTIYGVRATIGKITLVCALFMTLHINSHSSCTLLTLLGRSVPGTSLDLSALLRLGVAFTLRVFARLFLLGPDALGGVLALTPVLGIRASTFRDFASL